MNAPTIRQNASFARESIFATSNYDPFGMEKSVDDVLVDNALMKAVQQLSQFHKAGVRHGHVCGLSGNTQQILSERQGISLHALLLGYRGQWKELSRITDMLGFIASSDIPDFAEIFHTGNTDLSSYAQEVIFTLNWFSKLLHHHHTNGGAAWPSDRFSDFLRLGYGFHDVHQKCMQEQAMYGYVELDMRPNHHCGSMTIQFNLEKGETYIRAPEMIMKVGDDFKRFSETLHQDMPFVSRDHLNFLFPTLCWGAVFPFRNVTKIVLKTDDGEEKIYTPSTGRVIAGEMIRDYVDGVLNTEEVVK